MPWQPWRNGEKLEDGKFCQTPKDLSQLTVIIPARNEADFIGITISALIRQGSNLNIIVVDDDSSDSTVEIATQFSESSLKLIQSKPLPKGWTGKLWAQQQGLSHVKTPYVLLLDADIELVPNTINTVFNKLQKENLHFVSLMAKLRFTSFWEQLLMPAFIYFFKMLYPFRLSNESNSKVASAAGGFIMVETKVLKKIGGMAAIKNAIIDDCSLAHTIKSAGFRTWTGLTHLVISQRPYVNLHQIWDMVARTAFTQLHYSSLLLLGCTIVMVIMYWVPLIGLLVWNGLPFLLCVFSCIGLSVSYLPTLQYYSLRKAWVVFMPAIAGLYLLMTWSSAIRYWRGDRTRWKGRVYKKV